MNYKHILARTLITSAIVIALLSGQAAIASKTTFDDNGEKINKGYQSNFNHTLPLLEADLGNDSMDIEVQPIPHKQKGIKHQVAIETLQNAFIIGSLYQKGTMLSLCTIDDESICCEFDITKILSNEDNTLIKRLFDSIQKTAPSKRTGRDRVVATLRSISILQIKLNTNDLCGRHLIENVIINDNEESFKMLRQFFNKQKKARISTEITLNSPILMCLSGDNLPEFIHQADIEDEQSRLQKLTSRSWIQKEKLQKIAFDVSDLRKFEEHVYQGLYKLFVFNTFYADTMGDLIPYDLKQLVFIGFRVIPRGYDFCFRTKPSVTLESFPLTFKPIHQFPFGQLLTILDMSNKDMKIPNKWVIKLTNLTALNLGRNCEISEATLRALTKVSALGLDEDSMVTDAEIQRLTNLTQLSLKNNTKITGKGIQRLTNLASLNLSHNRKIKTIFLKKLTKLNTLDLSNNGMIKDPGVQNLVNLTDLNLTDNHTFTDNELKKLTNLTKLNLHNYTITDDGLQPLLKLTDLSIGGRDAGCMPSKSRITNVGISNFTNLTKLDLRHNHLITNDGLQPLVNLTDLTLGEEILITAEGFKYLVNLKSLILHFYIRSLYGVLPTPNLTDDVLQTLPNLTHLDLGSCESVTEEGILGLKKLRSFVPNYKMNDDALKRLGFVRSDWRTWRKKIQ